MCGFDFEDGSWRELASPEAVRRWGDMAAAQATMAAVHGMRSELLPWVEYAPEPLRLVYLESPFAGDVDGRYAAYLKAAMRDSLDRGEAPFASHALYVQFLDDAIPEERALGIAAGLAWGAKAEATVVYEDYGISPGMQRGIDRAREVGRPVEFRSLDGWRRG